MLENNKSKVLFMDNVKANIEIVKSITAQPEEKVHEIIPID